MEGCRVVLGCKYGVLGECDLDPTAVYPSPNVCLVRGRVAVYSPYLVGGVCLQGCVVRHFLHVNIINKSHSCGDRGQ